MKINLLYYTPIEELIKSVNMPYQSNGDKKLIKRVWNMGHRSIARHSIITFELLEVSQSLLRQISRHPHLNLTVKSTRYCNMEDTGFSIPPFVPGEYLEEYERDIASLRRLYEKWQNPHIHEDEKKRNEIAKMFLPLGSQTDLIVSGNYQAMYEFLQLRNCIENVEWEIFEMSQRITAILKKEIPEIFGDLGCRGDEQGYCIEFKKCNKYISKG